MTRLILCADDYALAPGIGRGIRRLLESGRLSATSCMTVSPHWPDEAVALRPYAQRADIGLHLTLTEQTPLGPMPQLAPSGRLPTVGVLLRRAITGWVDEREITAEIERQVDSFETYFGQLPAFLDGHQHVHQFPIVRQAVIAVWRRRLAGRPAWLRVCDEPLGSILRRRVAVTKSLVIASFGRALRRDAQAAGIPVNDRFAGVYDFSARVRYDELFARFVAAVPPDAGRLVVMCHPGEIDDVLCASDPVTDTREDELSYFASAAFTDLLQERGLTLTRFV